MGIIAKSELYYSDYTWEHQTGDNPQKIGGLDKKHLNRNEGYEILYFIDTFCNKYRLTKKSSALKVEKMIRKAPSEMRNQDEIEEWIKLNWKNY